MRLHVSQQLKERFVRTCSQTELDDLGDSKTLIDVKTRDSGPRLAQGRALIATTGTVHDNMGGFPKEFGERLAVTSLFVHEEAQQAIEYKSAVAIATPEAPCLYILVGDGNQAPGGVDSQNKAAQALRKDLMKLPIGLKAPKKFYTPSNFGSAICKLIDNLDGLDKSDLLDHM